MTNKQPNQRNLSPWLYKKDLALRQSESQEKKQRQKEEKLKRRWLIIRWSMFAYINIAFWLIYLFNMETQWTAINLTVALMMLYLPALVAGYLFFSRSMAHKRAIVLPALYKHIWAIKSCLISLHLQNTKTKKQPMIQSNKYVEECAGIIEGIKMIEVSHDTFSIDGNY